MKLCISRVSFVSGIVLAELYELLLYCGSSPCFSRLGTIITTSITYENDELKSA